MRTDLPPNRWSILAILFLARLGMGFQFQVVASMTPYLRAEFGLGLDQIGLLIGLYFVTGLVLALPGGTIAARYGAKRSVLFGLSLMILGGVLAAATTTWPFQILARVLAGTGGVLINVLMTKMATDWFSGKEIATAMAVFVSSWPAGIAIALVSVPALAARWGTASVFLLSAAICLIGWIAMSLFYQEPWTGKPALIPANTKWPSAPIGYLIILAGLVWGLFNAAFGMIFSFGPTMLLEKGFSVPAAGGAISIVLWLSILSVPAGGILSDKTRSPQRIIVACGVLIAIGIYTLGRSVPPYFAFIALGLIVGLPAGPIMALPAAVLEPAARGKGMALFYTVFYAVMVAAPILAGGIATKTGSAAAAFQTGAYLMSAGLIIYFMFVLLKPRIYPDKSKL